MDMIGDAGFMKMDTDGREKFLTGIEVEDDQPNPFHVLRGMTCQAYFTSEEGAKKASNHKHVSREPPAGGKAATPPPPQSQGVELK